MKNFFFNLTFLLFMLVGCANETVKPPPASQAPVTNSQKTEAPTTNSKPTPETTQKQAAPVATPLATGGKVTQSDQSSCTYEAGKAVNGQVVSIDLCSVRANDSGKLNFVYYLNQERIESEANCENGTWITFPERQVNRPQSTATQRMLDKVCAAKQTSNSPVTSEAGVAIVFDPPSNVRVSPNGEILCSVTQKTTIKIYGSNGDWYNTDICGSMGVIHKGQLKF